MSTGFARLRPTHRAAKDCHPQGTCIAQSEPSNLHCRGCRQPQSRPRQRHCTWGWCRLSPLPICLQGAALCRSRPAGPGEGLWILASWRPPWTLGVV